MSLSREIVEELRRDFDGQLRFDYASRVLYSTDASIYQIMPLGVALPRTQDDLQALVETAARHKIPILPRGAGTSLAGQAVGEALIVDCARWLDRVLDLDAETRTAVVEPGVVLGDLNRAALKHGLQFGPDPASAERATMGGVIGNNATGAHSIQYGMTADHLIEADVLLSDGSAATWGEVPDGPDVDSGDGRQSTILAAAREIRTRYASSIQANYPSTWRNSAGYRLNYLIPWAPSAPARWSGGRYPPIQDGIINLAPLLAGSEGTLAVLRRATVRLVPRPAHAVLAVLPYDSIVAACDDVPNMLMLQPSAIELVPQLLIRMARRIPDFARRMAWLEGDPAALLVVEFSGGELPPLRESARSTGTPWTVAETPEQQAHIWGIRKAGLGLMDSRPQAARPTAFIEDCAIPVERLGQFVREIERILAAHQAEGAIYAHASAGCLHVRPILDLKSPAGIRQLRAIAESVLGLTLKLGGAMSSEHGDGLARAEWLRQTYGPEVVAAMALLKNAADPNRLLNPGKMLDAPPMDTHLRYGPDYAVHPWSPSLTLASSGGLVSAIEQCNGQGACRKADGAMCPSYQATREEQYSTRGRANLLRALISAPPAPGAGRATSGSPMVESVAQALDLCLSCKGCTAECPSGVDMAKLKSEFLHEYHKTRRRPLRDYLFGYFHIVAGALTPLSPVVNALTSFSPIRHVAARLLRLTPHRPFPTFTSRRARPRSVTGAVRERVLFAPDVFTHFVEPEVEQAAFDLLHASRVEAESLSTIGAGAALLSKGMLEGARRHAGRLLDELARLDPGRSRALIMLEPPELHAFRHDIADLLPERRGEIADRAARAWLLEEWLVRDAGIGNLRVAMLPPKVAFLSHCHQRAEPPLPDGAAGGAMATLALLRAFGFDVESLEVGCCGMAGTFGYEAEHYDLSQRIGELRLFPRVRELSETIIAASGAACRLQISHGIGAAVEHPLVLCVRAVRESHGVRGDTKSDRGV